MVFQRIVLFFVQQVCGYFATTALGVLCAPIVKAIHNIYRVQSNVERLRRQAVDLEQRRADVEHDVNVAVTLQVPINEEVIEQWLIDVEVANGRFIRITNEGNLTCLTVYAFSMEAATLVENFAELLRTVPQVLGIIFIVIDRDDSDSEDNDSNDNDGDGNDNDGDDNDGHDNGNDGDDNDGDDNDGDGNDFPSTGLPKKVLPAVVEKYGGTFFWFNDGDNNDGDDNDFPSRKSRIIDVMEALKNLVIEVIRLHGMGCVGKTTLVRKVYSQLTKEPRLFDQVVMAEVSQNPDLIKVQGAIADRLGLKLQGETVDTRASQLRQWLKEKKRVLVILDDVWKELDLKAIGIPSGNADQGQRRMVVTSTGIPFGNADQGQCRIVVTSRSQNVSTIMKFEKHISVETLSYEEARILFWKTVDDAAKQSQFGSIATKIIEKCDGLPVAILAIAKTLKDSDHFVWNEVSKELANFDCIDAVPDFHPVLKLSYDYLKNEKAKSLLLLCSLHEVGHPIFIDHLVRCVIGLGFLQSVTSLKAARDEVDQLIKELKNANLLLDSDTKDKVKLHDVIHVVAQKIASREHKMFYIQDVVYLNEELQKDMYKDSTAISLHHGEVTESLEKLDFPKLELLLLRSERRYEGRYRYRSYLEIPDTFLGGMKELRVLVLNGICLQSFIPSLNYESLRTLSLEYCNVKDITKVGMLKKLEVLTFAGPNVKRLPEEIGDLTRLKLLDLERCSKLAVIPPNVISKLTRLEELYVSYSFVNWDTPDNTSLIELMHLQDLTVLYIHIVDAQIIPQDFFSEKLERFKIVIGEGQREKFYREAGESLESWMELNKFDEAEDWFNKFDEAGKQFGERKLLLKRANYLHCGVEKLLQKTEVLFIRDLDNLKKLYHGDSREEPSTMLKVIDVQRCAALTQLISSSMTRLEEIKVTDCENLTEIVGNDDPDDNITMSEIVFTELRTLTLDGLPKLMNFGPTAISRPLEIIQERGDEDLKSLFDNRVSFPSLKNLTLSWLDIPNIWCNQLPSSYSIGATLTSLDVKNCPHLRFLFSSSMVNGLQQLERLTIEDCESMEVIINNEGSSGEKVCDSLEKIFDVPEGSSNKAVIIFPKLTHLTLYALKKLKSFYHGRHISEWPSLKELSVEFCDKVEIFGSKYQSLCEEKQSVPQPLFIVNEDAFPRLENLVLLFNDNMKEIWHGGGIISKELRFEGKTNIIKFPHYLLPTDTLKVSSGYFKQIGGGSDNTFAAALLQLRTLKVDDVWKESLEASDSLECLVSSWVSFQNLTNLEIVSLRNGFRYVLTYSTAISLQHLTRLKIRYCKMLEVIIVPPTDEENDKIVFSQLKNLELDGLESLTSFYSGSHTLEFPSLEEMIVLKCPNMKVFSEGDSITPVLRGIQLENDDEWHWEGDLNNTIQKMFKEMNVQSQKED